MADIKTFKTITDKETRIHEVEIENDIPKTWNIKYSENVSAPEALIKYYRADEYGYKVLKEGKVWASNPLNFNDPFDCSAQLWIFDAFTVEQMKTFLNEILPNELNEKIHPLTIRKMFIELVLRFIGVYSLNDNSNSDLFWGYYNEHQGFSVNFKTELLSSFWNVLPFKVEYEEELKYQRIPFRFEEIYNKNIFPKIVRWATLKKQDWTHENEWRYIFMDIDLGNTNRLRKFPLQAIQEIVLGYKFFSNANYERINDRTTKYIFDKNYSYKILQFLFKNTDIALSQVLLEEDFTISNQRIHINEIKDNQVTIVRE